MHPYLPHLLADIHAAHRVIDLPVKAKQNTETNFDDVMYWLENNEPQNTFGYYCGLESINFPPTHQLSLQDIKLVCQAFQEMMLSWNLEIDMPEKLPLPIAYKMMVKSLDAKTEIVDSGVVTLDSCTGYAPDCIFKEFCPCLDVWDLFEDEESSSDLPDEELPF